MGTCSLCTSSSRRFHALSWPPLAPHSTHVIYRQTQANLDLLAMSFQKEEKGKKSLPYCTQCLHRVCSHSLATLAVQRKPRMQSHPQFAALLTGTLSPQLFKHTVWRKMFSWSTAIYSTSKPPDIAGQALLGCALKSEAFFPLHRQVTNIWL